jgi:peptidoglycan hydrolase CwlO-like protein
VLKKIIALLFIAGFAFITVLTSARSGKAEAISIIQQASPSRINSQVKDISVLSKQLEQKKRELAEINNKLENSSQKILLVYRKLDKLKLDLAKQQKRINKRLVEMYKSRPRLGALGLLLSSRGFNDFWVKARFLVKINSFDRQLLHRQTLKLRAIRFVANKLATEKQIQIKLRRQKMLNIISINSILAQKRAALEAMKPLKITPITKPTPSASLPTYLSVPPQ